MSSRVKQRHDQERFQALETMREHPESTPPFSYSTTEYSYAATDCGSAHRRHAGDRSTTHIGGVRYYGYRYYNPDLGRWVSRDPIGERSGVNIYEFLLNGTQYGIDILGHEVIYLPPGDGGPVIFLPPGGQGSGDGQRLRTRLPFAPIDALPYPFGVADEGYARHDDYFSKRHPGFIKDAKQRYILDIESKIGIQCGNGADFSDIKIDELYPFVNGCHDDQPQAPVEKGMLEGRFWAVLRNLEIKTAQTDACCSNGEYKIEVEYSAEVWIRNDPGSELFPFWENKNITEAKYPISGKVKCCPSSH